MTYTPVPFPRNEDGYLDRPAFVDKVEELILKQGKASAVKDETGLTKCRYRGPDGTMCAIGFFLTDDAAAYGDENDLLATRVLEIDGIKWAWNGQSKISASFRESKVVTIPPQFISKPSEIPMTRSLKPSKRISTSLGRITCESRFCQAD